MSFLTNWLYPSQTTVSDAYIQNHFQFLESSFQQPPSGTTANEVNSPTGATYSVENVITGRFLVRGGATTGPVNDTLPSAAEIVAYLKKLVLPLIIKPNFYMDWMVHNKTPNDVTVAGSGIDSIGPVMIEANQLATIRLFVTSIEEGSESVYLSILGL